MKNLTKLIFIFSSTCLIAKYSFATPIACPSSVICSKDKSISSCEPVGDNLKYWEKASASAPIIKGEYYFGGAVSSYQSPYTDEFLPVCQYLQKDATGKITGYIQIRIKQGSYFEALLTQSTHWRIGGYRADCDGRPGEPRNPQLCQFDELPLVSVSLKSANFITVSAYANSIPITPQPTYPSTPSIISMYQAWDGCSDSKQCKINFIAQNNGVTFDVGNIMVDMDNKMKILQINSSESSGYEILSVEDKNAIEITEKLLKSN